MSAMPDDTGGGTGSRELRLDRLLGRRVVAVNSRPVGRIEEFRAERRGTGIVVTGVVIGFAGLMERLDLGVKLLFGQSGRGYLAKWDQIDFSNPTIPRLTCAVEELEEL
jgi:hypothetical protein